jgi:hypothetical protein
MFRAREATMARRERERGRESKTERGREPFPEGRSSAKKGDPPLEEPFGERSRHGVGHEREQPGRGPAPAHEE